MAVKHLNFEALSEIDDGRIKEAWEQAAKRARDDCADRPGVLKARKVTLTMTLTPVSASDGSLDTVDVQFEIDDSLPKRISAAYNMKAVRGGLLFNDLSPDDIKQGTLDDVAGLREVMDAR